MAEVEASLASVAKDAPNFDEAPEPVDEVEAARIQGRLEMARAIIELDPADWSMVRMALLGSMANAGRNLGISRQAAWKQYQKLKGRVPWLGKIGGRP